MDKEKYSFIKAKNWLIHSYKVFLCAYTYFENLIFYDCMVFIKIKI